MLAIQRRAVGQIAVCAHTRRPLVPRLQSQLALEFGTLPRDVGLVRGEVDLVGADGEREPGRQDAPNLLEVQASDKMFAYIIADRDTLSVS